jgi:hypothetical protein
MSLIPSADAVRIRDHYVQISTDTASKLSGRVRARENSGRSPILNPGSTSDLGRDPIPGVAGANGCLVLVPLEKLVETMREG